MILFDLIGWSAAGFTLLAYSQRTMLPLRLSAISASICFIIWSLYVGIYPTLALHSVLLPLNSFRLSQVILMKREAKAALRADGFSLDWIRPLVRTIHYEDGSYVFRKGDRPDKMYYVVAGKVVFDEVRKHAQAGEIFGELAFFTQQQQRTASARCEGTCEVMALNEADFTRLFLQNPAFNLYVVRIIAERLAGHPVAPEDFSPRSSRGVD